MIKSKYTEDAFFGEHTAVWGSWYNKQDDSWGYACCHGKDINSPECPGLLS
jgi:hypothetical protein